MKRYADKTTGERILEVSDLSFLKEREHPYGWFRRHRLHFGLHLAVRWADRIKASDEETADDLVRFYFIPREKVEVMTGTDSPVTPPPQPQSRHADPDRRREGRTQSGKDMTVI